MIGFKLVMKHQQWLRQWRGSIRHQATTCTNVDLVQWCCSVHRPQRVSKHISQKNALKFWTWYAAQQTHCPKPDKFPNTPNKSQVLKALMNPIVRTEVMIRASPSIHWVSGRQSQNRLSNMTGFIRNILDTCVSTFNSMVTVDDRYRIDDGSGNALAPSGNKPPMMTKLHAFVASTSHNELTPQNKTVCVTRLGILKSIYSPELWNLAGSWASLSPRCLTNMFPYTHPSM